MVWIHPPHLINVAALPCESRNTENACEHTSEFNVNLQNSCYMHQITLTV